MGVIRSLIEDAEHLCVLAQDRPAQARRREPTVRATAHAPDRTRGERRVAATTPRHFATTVSHVRVGLRPAERHLSLTAAHRQTRRNGPLQVVVPTIGAEWSAQQEKPPQGFEMTMHSRTETIGLFAAGPDRAPFVESGAPGWEWRQWAACRGMDGSSFFHPDRESGKARAARIGRAKAVCACCRVLADCRAYVLQVGEPFGIWGGLSEEERHPLGSPTPGEWQGPG